MLADDDALWQQVTVSETMAAPRLPVLLQDNVVTSLSFEPNLARMSGIEKSALWLYSNQLLTPRARATQEPGEGPTACLQGCGKSRL